MPGRRTSLALALFALLAVLLVPAGLAVRSTPAAAKIVNVKAGDKGFTLSVKTAPAGAVTFVVKNVGELPHGFKISTRKTPVLAPGKTARLALTFKKAGPVAYSPTVKADVAR